MSVQIVNIELLGLSFAVQTDESAEYMEGLLGRLRERLDSLKASTHVQDPLKLSILASITFLDELARAKEGFLPRREDGQMPGTMRASQPVGEDEFSQVAARLIADLDRSLEGGES